MPCGLDGRPLGAADARRLADVVAASWRVLNDTWPMLRRALRKGPSGGGRDRGHIVAHVAGAECASFGKVSPRGRGPANVGRCLACCPRPRARALESLGEAVAVAVRRASGRMARPRPPMGDRGQVGPLTSGPFLPPLGRRAQWSAPTGSIRRSCQCGTRGAARRATTSMAPEPSIWTGHGRGRSPTPSIPAGRSLLTCLRRQSDGLRSADAVGPSERGEVACRPSQLLPVSV